MQIPPEFSAFGECVSAEGQAFPVRMPPLSLQAAVGLHFALKFSAVDMTDYDLPPASATLPEGEHTLAEGGSLRINQKNLLCT
jgi:hypothetical protein